MNATETYPVHRIHMVSTTKPDIPGIATALIS